MTKNPINNGVIEWTGDNSAIYLKESENGPATCAVSLFRILYSPQYGPGHAVVLLWNPQGKHPHNGIYTDNVPLAEWLRDTFAAHFSAFKGNSLLYDLPMRQLTACERSGDARYSYREIITGPELDLRLTWSDLGSPYLVEFAPEHSVTGAHEMFSVFVPAETAKVMMNGETAQGDPAPKAAYGRERGTAFLALSETWIRPLVR